jgi:C6 transcription factor Pro1
MALTGPVKVFRTLGGNWPIHIQAARTFLSMIGSSTFRSRPSSTSSKDAPERSKRLDILEQILKDDSHRILPRSATAALKHFVTSFVWVDILSRASGFHPSPLSLPQAQVFNYLPLLEDSTLDLSRVMGCENWVFTGMARIVCLEAALAAQPRGGGASHDPQALDLHSRATVLQTMLERGIRGLLEARAGLGSELEWQSSLVTELFARAALTYLHVTMVGAWPWLPSIRASVARTVEALEALPEEVLIRVSWPFAVTGCMVLEEKQEAVRGVFSRATRKGVNTGTVWKGMTVVEECWRLRGAGVGVEVSWVNAMESLGEKILLC